MAIENFKHRYADSVEDTLNIGKLISEGNLTNEETQFLHRIKEAWNFYEGYHWEGIDDLDIPQVTFNYCRPFVNKFVSFELGKGFTIKTPTELDDIGVTIDDDKLVVNLDENEDGNLDEEEKKLKIKRKTVNDYLNEVWDNNHKETLCTELGQTKSITGESWIKIQYESPEDLNDVFEEYPNGRIRLSVIPTQYVFPRFNDHDKDKLEHLLIMYPIKRDYDTGILFKRTTEMTVIYKEFWTDEEIVVYEDGNEVDRMSNPYGFIPFVQIKNFPIAGRTRGVSDIEDIIPLNVELNTKRSDVSEVIDYHSAPITLVYGAKIGNLEKGANKVWGGLPKDAKVENLHLQGDLTASVNYTSDLKTAMCEIAGIPETVLGGASAISNTSGVALQYMNLPLIDRTNVKRGCTKNGLEKVNKMILYMSLYHGLIEKPDFISMKDFLSNEVKLPDTLPKDLLLELQMIQQELTLGIECRHGAMQRLGVDNIPQKISEVDEERKIHPELFNPMLQQTWYQNESGMTPTNAGGMMNGQTPQEEIRKTLTGQNGGAEV